MFAQQRCKSESEEAYFKMQNLQKYKNGVNTRFLYKIQCRICSRVHSLQNSILAPSKMSLNFAIWIKTQYLLSNLRQNAITPGVVRSSILFFSFINLYCNWNLWLPECFYHLIPQRDWKTFIVVLHNVITFNFPVWYPV